MIDRFLQTQRLRNCRMSITMTIYGFHIPTLLLSLPPIAQLSRNGIPTEFFQHKRILQRTRFR